MKRNFRKISRHRFRLRTEQLEARRLLALSDFVINEILADPAASIDGDANGDGVRDGSDDEFIEIVNTGLTIDIGGWTLSDSVGVKHIFPSPTNVAEGQAVVVFGGVDASGSFGAAIVQTASSGSLGLNNRGDSVAITNNSGDRAEVTYGTEAGDDRSLTRVPDLTGPFVLHDPIGTTSFSPGFRSDGITPFSSLAGEQPNEEEDENEEQANSGDEPTDPPVGNLTLDIWLNEFHYDNVGTDVGESIEVAGAAGTDLEGASIVLYNGNGGVVYETISLTGILADESGAVGTLNFTPNGSLQNGPDGIALINPDGSVVEFVSYEGSFAATDGPAAGMTSVDVGVVEPGEEGTSLQRSNNSPNDVWVGPFPASPGSLNSAAPISPIAPPDFSIVAVNSIQPEGNTGQTEFTFSVSRSGSGNTIELVDFAVSGNSANPADAADFGGAFAAGTLQFGLNETSQFVSILVTADTLAESDETFSVSLDNPSSGGTISVRSAEGIILNDDIVSTSPISIWLNEFHYDNLGPDENEFIEIAGPAGTDVGGASIVLYNGNDGAAYSTIPLSGTITETDNGIGFLVFPADGIQNGPDGIALVNRDGSVIEFLSYEGTFVASDGPADGLSSVDIEVSEPGQPDETLQRENNSATSLWFGPAMGTPNDANGILAPVEPSTFAIESTTPEQTEGDAGTIEFIFQITRSGDLSETGVINFFVDGTTANADDFGGVLPSGNIEFEPGASSKTISVQVVGDNQFENDESFLVFISATNETFIIAKSTAEATIRNDDNQPTSPVDPVIPETPTDPIDIWLNEFHYDNVGPDIDEKIEVAGIAGLDITSASIVLYNGNGGTFYRTIELEGTIPDQGNGVGTISFDADGIQNGPDGIALINTDGTVVEFLSYEGTFTANDGPAEGVESIDVGSIEPVDASEAERIGENYSIQRTANTKSSPWSGPNPSSFGALNTETETETETPSDDSIEIDKFLWDINGKPWLHHNLQVGDELIYSFNVSNSGSTTLRDVTVVDPLPGLIMDDEVAEPYIAFSQSASIDGATTSDLQTPHTQAWDNFEIDDYTVIDGLTWTGSYSESFEFGPGYKTDFLLEVFADNNGQPSESVHSFLIAGGLAGVNDQDVQSVLLEESSTEAGPAFEYHAMLPFTMLSPGKYWLSISAQQTSSDEGTTMPEWRWHLGDGPNDGVWLETSSDPTTLQKNEQSDLAFSWQAARLIDFDGTLLPNETVMFMGTYHVTENDMETERIVNVATAIANGDVGEVTDTDEFIWTINDSALAISGETQSAVISSTPTDAIDPGNSNDLSPIECNHVGDFDQNGMIDFADFLILQNNYGRSQSSANEGDIDCDGTVGFSDFLVLSDNFGLTTDEAHSNDTGENELSPDLVDEVFQPPTSTLAPGRRPRGPLS